MRKTKIITTKQKKKYTNKTTKEPMHSQAKIKKEQNSKHETKKKTA